MDLDRNRKQLAGLVTLIDEDVIQMALVKAMELHIPIASSRFAMVGKVLNVGIGKWPTHSRFDVVQPLSSPINRYYLRPSVIRRLKQLSEGAVDLWLSNALIQQRGKNTNQNAIRLIYAERGEVRVKVRLDLAEQTIDGLCALTEHVVPRGARTEAAQCSRAIEYLVGA